jgi:3-hydroxyacyl-[acyl-carrier-protein] dehydratase
VNDADILATALAFLPHGPEFRFVDRLTALEPGVRGEGEYTVRGDEPFLRGHFPGDPLMPGVLLLEAVAQLAGVVAQSDPNHAPMPGLKLTALRQVKILGTARPGEILQIRVEINGRLGNLVQATGTVRLPDRVLLQADVTLAGQAAP